jgi:hypothetical protein
MSWTPPPTDEQLRRFLRKLRAWRATLAEVEQKLVDSMLAAALGQASGPSVGEAEPIGDAGGEDPPGAECAAGDGWCWPVARWLATPWGLAYTIRYW